MPNHITNIVITNLDLSKYEGGGADEETKKPYKIDFDFNKIIPMPESLHINGFHGGVETWVKICSGQINFKSFLLKAQQGRTAGDALQEGGFGGAADYLQASTAFETLLGERESKNIKDFNSEEFEAFVQGLKNYREHGYMSWYEWSCKFWGTKWNAYDFKKTEGFLTFNTAWAHPKPIFLKLSSLHPEEKIQVLYNDEGYSKIYLFTYKNGELIEEKEAGNIDYHEDEEKEGYIFEGKDFEDKDQILSHVIRTAI